MRRELSGTFRRATRVQASSAVPVRLLVSDPARELHAQLLELGTMDLLLSGVPPLALGTWLSVVIPLPDRYLEFEIRGMVSWRRDGQFGVSFDHLTLRQTFALVLAIDLMSRAGIRLPASAGESTR
jgi:PilZ domain-containing protein